MIQLKHALVLTMALTLISCGQVDHPTQAIQLATQARSDFQAKNWSALRSRFTATEQVSGMSDAELEHIHKLSITTPHIIDTFVCPDLIKDHRLLFSVETGPWVGLFLICDADAPEWFDIAIHLAHKDGTTLRLTQTTNGFVTRTPEDAVLNADNQISLQYATDYLHARERYSMQALIHKHEQSQEGSADE